MIAFELVQDEEEFMVYHITIRRDSYKADFFKCDEWTFTDLLITALMVLSANLIGIILSVFAYVIHTRRLFIMSMEAQGVVILELENK